MDTERRQQHFDPLDALLQQATLDSSNHEHDPTSDKDLQGDLPAPSLMEMTGSFMGAMARFARGGFQVVSQEVFQARLETCRQCPKLDHGSCQLCGCFVELKAKLPQESCPLSMWASLE